MIGKIIKKLQIYLQTDNLKISINENLIIKNRFKFGKFER